MDPEPILDDEDGGDEEENAAKNFHNHVADESVLKNKFKQCATNFLKKFIDLRKVSCRIPLFCFKIRRDSDAL